MIFIGTEDSLDLLESSQYKPPFFCDSSFAFIAYLVILQLFLLYVRIRAKAANDRTPVTLTNPLTNLVQSQLEGPDGNTNAMMKNLASSFLKSESTALEYDLKQARSMQGGLLFNMAFMWLLHFKMEQIQPLLINTVTGLLNMAYSPLFQVYILGRNLERPFKNPAIAASKKAGDIIIGNAGGAAVTERKANSRDLLTLIDPLCEKVRKEWNVGYHQWLTSTLLGSLPTTLFLYCNRQFEKPCWKRFRITISWEKRMLHRERKPVQLH